MVNNFVRVILTQAKKYLVNNTICVRLSTKSNSSGQKYLLNLHLAGSSNIYQKNCFTTTSKSVLQRNMTEKPKVVFVLGGPGAGKGTQCQLIVEEFGFVHLSAGDLLRAERSREGSEYGEMIEECIRNGKIVPVEVTCSLIDNAMQDNIKQFGKYKFLIDGFPRNQDNLDGWNKKMSDKVNFMFVLFFNCDQKICIDRCLARGKAGSGRSDDNEESMKKRISTYVNDSLPIIEHYRKLNKVREIDAAPEPEVVFEAVKLAFRSHNDETN
ncbi:UMP-CMP kinase [Condylostylus longicornis]|uniref:UMP-CMP kinase n=1 Tax=Condylostylus longicornis TaxID=2530218 RepID=UPI00244E552E|nr:UMP-CMP kinase [Condylostylus longicornis]